MEVLLSKAVDRLGKKRVWVIVHAIRLLPHSECTPVGVREALRGVHIFLDDSDFASIQSSFAAGDGPDASFDTNAFIRAFIGLLPTRRRHVVELVLRKLDPDGSGFIAFGALREAYDVLRHPDVLTLREPRELTAEFFQNFEDGNDEAGLTCEELLAYYLGLSHCTSSDGEFELMCIRSFSLDRPRPSLEDGDRNRVSRSSLRRTRSIGEAHAHPLYQTTYSEYGKGCEKGTYDGRFGRSHCFTKYAVAQKGGGATSMNM